MSDHDPTTPRLPRLIFKGHRAYWQASGGHRGERRKIIAIGAIDDPQTIARYHDLECQLATPQNSLSFIFDRFHDGFLDDTPGDQGTRRIKELSAPTRREYRRQLKTLRAAFGAMRPPDLQPIEVQKYLERHPAPVSANREIALLARIFSWACRIGLAERNPCTSYQKNEEFARDRYITDAEYLRRKRLAPLWMGAVMDLGYLTALRLSDLLAIRLGTPVPGDKRLCHLDNEALHVIPAKTRKRHRRRLKFRLDGALGEVVEQLRTLNAQRATLSTYLIANRRGQPYTLHGFVCIWKRLKHKDGNPDFQFRDIRAKSATDAADQGLNPQLLLAHASERTTQIYLRSRRAVVVEGPKRLISTTPPARKHT